MFLRLRDLRAHALRLSCVVLLTLSASACTQVDLKTALEIQELTSGYYDAGVTDAGLNKLVPSVTFRVKNISSEPISSVDLMVFFWGVENELPRELDEVLLTAVGSEPLAPGAMTEPIVVRSKQGFSIEQPRAELFNHGQFRDTTAKVFMKRGGKIVPFGEYTTERRLLLSAPAETIVR